ncbi:uncharacterized protein LOC116129306 isoform X2 [Pistacia vera]|uniref:uncharacterized protein LOC116129306 isoform X2 n=1 Tax=Pistacia vera TaxID=55513 RepID=UPI0012638A56|nr:uncharacterized protein LOC116129306 isoform X2 [Pistacia vera]
MYYDMEFTMEDLHQQYCRTDMWTGAELVSKRDTECSFWKHPAMAKVGELKLQRLRVRELSQLGWTNKTLCFWEILNHLPLKIQFFHILTTIYHEGQLMMTRVSY